MSNDVNAISPDVPGPGDIGRICVPDLVRRSARKSPNRTAVIDRAQRVSYAQLDADINRIANALLAEKLPRGARVATLCKNSYELVVAMFGIVRAGLVWLPINHTLAADDVDYIFGHAQPAFVFVDEGLYTNPLAALIDDRIGAAAIVCANPAVVRRYSTFDALLRRGSPIEPNAASSDRDVCQIMYTSGTTGRPKGVMHTHVTIMLALLGNAIEIGMRDFDIAAVMLPLFHCAQHTLVAGSLLTGGTIVILRSYDPVEFMQTIEREKVTLTLSLPPIYGALLDHPDRRAYDLSSLRLCVYGMMQMSEPMLRRLSAEICPNWHLGAGQTEMYPATNNFKPAYQLTKIGPYWGESSIVNETAIMDDAGNLVGPGETGEIVHRGPNVMAGYFRDPVATEQSRAFGWHHTGDLGTIDADGHVIFTDRKKDMIKSGGENVASIVVERALLAHPAIARAAAVGLPHARWGEAVTGVVQLKADSVLSNDELLAHCRARLSRHEVPKQICFVNDMPLTATGKVQKNVLRMQFAELYAEQTASVT